MDKKPKKGTKQIALSNITKICEQLTGIEFNRNKLERELRQLANDKETLIDELKMNSYLSQFGWFYIGISSTDCDCVQSYSVQKFQSIKSYCKYRDNRLDWADGPTYFAIISKSDYDLEREHPTRNRDRIMEAYENGNGSSIIV
jgi:hypothetical protein